MRTIAIVNQKGGCGKTTTAINLSAVMARRGQRTLLVDMDPQSHCAAGLGVPESAIQRGVGEVLLGDLDRPVDPSSFLWEVSRNLHLAPSTVSLAALEAAAGGLSGLPDRDRRLSRLLAWLAPRFDLCIVDCPPTIGLLTFNALRAADEAIVPVETGFFSLRGAEKQTATINRLVERLGRPLPFRLLATLYDDSRPIDRDVLDQLRKKYGEAVLPMVVADHEVLREAASIGSAVTEFAPRSAAEADFDALAAWLLEHPPAVLANSSPPPTPLKPERLELSIGVPHRPPSASSAGESIAVQPHAGFASHSLSQLQRAHSQSAPSMGAHDRRTEPVSDLLANGRSGHDQDVHASDAPEPLLGQHTPTRAAELARRVRDLNSRPSAEELAMLTEPLRRGNAETSRAAEGQREIRISLPRGLAFRVAVAGDFNGWRQEPLELHPESGVFELRRPVRPGRYRYRLLVDGREALDPTNPAREPGPDGRDVSVVEVTP